MNLSVMDKDRSEQLLLPGFQKESEQGKGFNHRGSLMDRTRASIGGGRETSLCERPRNLSERKQEEVRRSDGRREALLFLLGNLMRIAGFGRTERPVRRGVPV